MAKGTKLLEPININFKELGQKQFRTVDSVTKWADEEFERLGELNSLLARAKGMGNAQLLVQDMQETLLGKLRPIAKAALDAGEGPTQQAHFNNIRSLLQQYNDSGNTNQYVSAGAPSIRHFLEDGARNPDAAALTIAKMRNRPIGRNEISDARIFTEAVLTTVTGIGLARKAVDGQADALAELRSEWEDNFDNLFESLEAMFSDLKDEMKTALAAGEANQTESIKQGRKMMRTFVKARRHFEDKLSAALKHHESRMETIEIAFATDMRLRAGERYWGEKRQIHDRTATKWLKKFFFWTAGATVFLLLLYAAIYAAVPKGTGFNAASFFAYGLPTVLVLWGLRILANIYRENRDLADDAAERVAMVMTFKALEFEHRVSDEERLIILNALFRPHSRGPEDGMPNALWEAVLKKIGPGRQGG